MKIKGTSSSTLLILFALFALIIYQVDACSSTKENGKANKSPELKATPIFHIKILMRGENMDWLIEK